MLRMASRLRKPQSIPESGSRKKLKEYTWRGNNSSTDFFWDLKSLTIGPTRFHSETSKSFCQQSSKGRWAKWLSQELCYPLAIFIPNTLRVCSKLLCLYTRRCTARKKAATGFHATNDQEWRLSLISQSHHKVQFHLIQDANQKSKKGRWAKAWAPEMKSKIC